MFGEMLATTRVYAPLALCDGLTVEPKDLVVFEIHMPDRLAELLV